MRKHTKFIVFILVITALVGVLTLSACKPKVTPTGIALNDSNFAAVAYGGQLDLSGKKVIVSYDNDTTTESDLTAIMLSGFSNTTVGQQTVTVTMAVDETTFTTTFTVTVLPADMTGISVTTQPKTEYFEGELFDATGMVVTASFEDGSTRVVNDYTVDKTVALTTADTRVTITYGSFSTTVDISVIAVVITGIGVKSQPSNVNYYAGQTFNADGLEIEATYNNGTKSDVTDFEVDTTTPLTVEDTSVTITYGEFSTSVDITVVVARLTGIEVNGGAFADVTHHQELDLTDRTITLTFEDNSTEEIPLIASMLSGFDKDTVGTQTVTVTYTVGDDTVTTTFSVNVVKYATGIEVVTPPSDTSYYAGQTFDKTGLTVQIVYSDETTEVITDFEVDTTTPLVEGATSVTITFGDFNTTQAISVLADEVDTVEIAGDADLGDVYLKNLSDSYDLKNMQIVATYLSGKTETIDVTLNMCSTIDAFGQQNVTVTYEGKTATFAINVIENVVVTFEIVDEPRLSYYEGQIFDASGMTYKIVYTNGEEVMTDDVTITLSNLDGEVAIGDALAIGTYTVTVSYSTELYATLTVEVIADNIVGIEITTAPKTTYYEGETFDPTGMVITATYESGKEVDVTADTTNDASGPMQSNTLIEFSYNGFTTTLSVIVLRDEESAAIFDVVALNNTRELNLVVSEDTEKLYEFSSFKGELFVNDYVDSSAFASLTDKLIGVGALSISKDYFLNFDITGESTARVLSATLSANAPFIPANAISPKLVVVVNLDTQELISYTVSYSVEAMGLLDVVISVADETITSVVVKNAPAKTEYFEGETFDASGLVLSVTLGNEETFDTTRFAVKNPILVYGEAVVVIFNGYEVILENIVITQVVVERIEVTAVPNKVDYVAGETFDATGMVVTAYYNNGDSVILQASEYTVSPSEALATTDTAVTITYNGTEISTMVNITVAEPTVEPEPETPVE